MLGPHPLSWDFRVSSRSRMRVIYPEPSLGDTNKSTTEETSQEETLPVPKGKDNSSLRVLIPTAVGAGIHCAHSNRSSHRGQPMCMRNFCLVHISVSNLLSSAQDPSISLLFGWALLTTSGCQSAFSQGNRIEATLRACNVGNQFTKVLERLTGVTKRHCGNLKSWGKKGTKGRSSVHRAQILPRRLELERKYSCH